MHVVLYCPGMPFNGATIAEGHSLGGSESAAYYLARELAVLGMNVTMFTSIPPAQEGAWDGVRYLSAGAPTQAAPLGEIFEWYAASTPHDVLIVQRAPEGFHRPFASKVNFWWSHDLALKRHLPALARQLWNVDRVLAVSEFHRGQIASVFGYPAERIEVVPNGVDLALFPGEPDPERARVWAERKWSGGRMIYSSRPERGLAYLVERGGLMDRLRESAPDLRLEVAGYDNTVPAMRALYERLWGRCRELPNVDLLGPLSKQALADRMREAFLHLYPTTFEEVSCITAMEAQAAGNPIVTSRLAALPETLRGGAAVWLDPDPATLPTEAEAAVLGLRGDRAAWEDLHRGALAKSSEFGWRPSAEKVLSLAESVMRGKSASPRRLARHLIRHSDILACRELVKRHGEDGFDPPILEELRSRYRFVEDGTYREQCESLARWQAERGIDHGHNDPDRLFAMPRFRVVEERVAALPPGSRVLDYACGQGHFTAALARRYPDLVFLGVDIAPTNVGIGNARIAELGLSNVHLLAGEAGELSGPFDLVLASEVMEHVPDPAALADRLESLLMPEGELCLTVPFGPWEVESYATVPFRAHVHELERADLAQLWGPKRDYAVLAVPVRFTELGEPLGCYRVTFRRGGNLSGGIDLQRKLTQQAPRETVTVCMVCRDSGAALARTLESVGPFADQIVIGIDSANGGTISPFTSDAEEDGGRRTAPAWEIARRFGAEAFAVPSPLVVGFDAVRNLTLQRAWGDWVLWIDDDEVFEWPERLIKYLRPNGYEAYALKQHHYAVEPEGVIKTDYPCRLFRRSEGVRFYGLVHEHPERGLNRGFGQVLLLPDVAICHAGYDTEDVRRRRFHRNLPLMARDRELYPERLLGKFLWIRDLAHLNRYAWEQCGTITEPMRRRAEEAVHLWRDLLARGQSRMAVDALPYYSEAVQLLAGEGIAFQFGLAAGRAGLGDANGHPPQTLFGHFLDTGDIRQLTEALVRERTQLFDERYF
jgi:glycosyltransferase involved in cell wall biosynthesis/SAM-dependent methyltransferase